MSKELNSNLPWTPSLLVILVIFMVLTGCHHDHAALPEELVGIWATDDPVYKGRSLKLEKEYVLVGFGKDENPTVQRITKVETFRDGTTNATTIYSTDKDGPQELTVYFEPSDGGSLFIKNLRGRWHRQ